MLSASSSILYLSIARVLTLHTQPMLASICVRIFTACGVVGVGSHPGKIDFSGLHFHLKSHIPVESRHSGHAQNTQDRCVTLKWTRVLTPDGFKISIAGDYARVTRGYSTIDPKPCPRALSHTLSGASLTPRAQHKRKNPTPQPLRAPRACARAPQQHAAAAKNGKGVTIAVAARRRRRRLPGGWWD